jgi:hypothetical protein
MSNEIAIYRTYQVDTNGNPQGVTLDTTNYTFTKIGVPVNDGYGGLNQKYKITQKETSINPKANSTTDLENLFKGMTIGGRRRSSKRRRTKRRRTLRRRTLRRRRY